MSTPSVDEFLNRNKTYSFSFKGEPIKGVRGTVISAEMMQQMDFETGLPKWWGSDNKPLAAPRDANGNPPAGAKEMWQLAVRLQTNLRNGEGTAKPQEAAVDDNGVRGVYLSGNKLKAVQTAFQAKNISQVKLEPGDELFLEYYADDHAAQRGNFSPPKLFRADIVKGPGVQAAVFNQPAAVDPWGVSAPAAQPAYAGAVAAPAASYAAPPAAPAAIPAETLAQLPDATIELLKAQGTIPADWVRPV